MVVDLIIGIVGMFFILVAFVMDEFYKEWSQNTVKYNFINIIGSGLLTYYAYTLSSWPFIILNTIWLVVAISKLVKVLK